jgi:hypothetical protein
LNAERDMFIRPKQSDASEHAQRISPRHPCGSEGSDSR